MTGIRNYKTNADLNTSVGGISTAEGMARPSVNNAMRAQMADVANLLLDQGGAVTTTGSSNAYLLTLPTAPTAYADNLAFIAKLNHAVLGPSTININGIGVKPLKKLVEGVATDLEEGDGYAGDRIGCIYSSSDNAVLIISGGGIASGNFIQVGDDAVRRTVQDRLRDTLHLLDFVPPEHHAALYAGTLITDVFDMSDAMDAALDALTIFNINSPSAFAGGPTILLPAGYCRFSRAIILYRGVILQGVGSTIANGGSVTILEFDPYVPGTDPREGGHGIMVWPGNKDYYNNTVVPASPDGSKFLRDFDLRSTGRSNNVSIPGAIGHGIWARAGFSAENLHLVNWPDDGVHIVADSNVSLSSFSFGNANRCFMQRCRIQNCGRHGIYIAGGDANAGLFNAIDTSSNFGHGVYDSSFLGNTWIAPHAYGNGLGATASHRGVIYFIRSEAAATVANTSPVEPGVTPGWEDVWEIYASSNHNPIYRIWSPSITNWIHGRSYFMDSNSVTGGVVISPYTEGNQPSKSLAAPWIVVDSLVGAGVPAEAENSAMYFGNTVISPFSVPAPTAGKHPINSSFNNSADDLLTFNFYPSSDTGLALSWDDATGSFSWRYGGSSFSAMRFTTDLSKSLTGGRGDPIPAGRAMFQNFWLGETTATARYMSNAVAMPTSGTWAKGDIVWNNAPAFNGAPGWMCTTGGSSITTGWNDFTAYAAGTIRRNPNTTGANNYRAVPGTSAASGGPTGTAAHILDGSVAWAYQTPVAWEPGDSRNEQALGDPYYNGGPKLSGIIDGTVYWLHKPSGGGTTAWAPNTSYVFDTLVTNGGNTYFCCNPGVSAASGGPTGTGDITDGGAVWRQAQQWRAVQKQGVGDIILNDAATWECTAITTGTTGSSGPQTPGPVVVDGGVTWTIRTFPLPDWLPNTAYAVDDDILNSGLAYYCVTAGTSDVANYYVAVNHTGNTCGNEGTGPLGLGEITDGSCVWINEWRKTTTETWAPSTAYAIGDLVRSRTAPGDKSTGWTYVCIQAGTSGTVAIDNDGGIPDGTLTENVIRPWAPNLRYELGDLATNDTGKLYKVVNGISGAAPGPTGTGTGILDGSVCWDYSTAPVFAAMPRLGLETQQTLADIVAGFTLSGATSPHHTVVTGTFPATNLTCTLSTANDYAGLSFRISRTAVGAGELTIGTGTPLTLLSEGEWCVVVSNGTTWYLESRGRLQPDKRQETITTNAAFTITPFSTAQQVKHTGTLTADRAVTLTTTNAFNGLTYRITRTGGGAFNLNVGTGPLKALATNTWADFTYDGSAYYLAAYGAL